MDGLAQSFIRDLSFVEDRPGIEDLAFTPGGQGIVGILYVEDFDAAADPAPCVPEEPPPPLFTEDDVARARAEGHAAGMQAALHDAGLVQDQLRLAALQGLGDALIAARSSLERAASDSAGQAVRLLLAVLQAAIPTIMARHAAAEAESMLAALLPGLRYEPRLRVRTHPDLADTVRASLTQQLPPDGCVVSVVADASLAPPDVRIAWEDGGAERSGEAIWNAIRAALQSLQLPSFEEVCHDHRG